MVNHLERTQRIIDEAADAGEMRRRLGASAIALDPAGEASAPWRTTVAQRLPGQDWPDRELLITAVDAETGEPVVFDRRSGVDLVDAVAASTAGSFAYRIGGHPYIDGGYRTNAENADLAAGYQRVLVLSPFGGRTRLPLEWGLDLATQVTELRSGGSVVHTLFPDDDSLAAFGGNMMDLSTRIPAARAGHAQGLAAAGELYEFWNDPQKLPT